MLRSALPLLALTVLSGCAGRSLTPAEPLPPPSDPLVDPAVPVAPKAAPPGAPAAADEPFRGKPDAGQELERFYDKLRALERGERADHVRVLWMGDSHAAADFWSGKLRSELQQRFGNGGVGFVHLGYKDYRHDHVKLTIGGKWRMRPKGPATSKPSGDGAFGLGGILMGGYADGPRVALELRDPDLEGPVRYDLCFKLREPHDRFTVGVGEGDPITVGVSEQWPVGPIHHLELTARQARTLTLEYKDGSPDLCGVVIESEPSREPGVVLDTLGINGARFGTALAWDEAAWQSELIRRRPDLVILEYGTNEAGDFAPDYDGTAQNLEALVARIRAVAAHADCVVISPTDRADAEDRIPPMHSALKASAEAAGCYFYDAYLAMGEKGAMARMRDESPPRAHADGIHMTIRGYREYGGKLLDDLLAGYGPP